MNIIKSSFISKIIHVLLSLPSPKNDTLETMGNIFDNFLWKRKSPKFKKSIIENLVGEGTQYSILKHKDKVLEISWYKRLYNSNAGWATVSLKYKLNLVYIFWDRYWQRIHDNINNKFWKYTFRALIEVKRCTIPNSVNVKEGKLESWVEKGLLVIL